MNVFLALLATFCTAYASPVMSEAEQAWEHFKLRHSKTYANSLEEITRKRIFMKKWEQIWRHNKNYLKGLETFTMDLNHLSDMLPREIHAPLRTILGHRNLREFRSSSESGAATNKTLPKSVDWRPKGAVTPVKNQEKCASCYAFATTGALEGQIFMKTGLLEPLSEQNLIDCTYRLGTTGGCEGGNVPSALKYAMVFGVDTEAAYPYKASTGRCRRNATAIGPKTKIVEYQQVQPASETALMAAVATIGPVASCFQITSKFDNYKSGVFYQENCEDDSYTGHCALVVGYGTTDDGQDYWLVKNSMGAEYYGENGYIRMARNKNNMCGIASFAYYPIV